MKYQANVCLQNFNIPIEFETNKRGYLIVNSIRPTDPESIPILNVFKKQILLVLGMEGISPEEETEIESTIFN